MTATSCFSQPTRDDCKVACGAGGACPDNYDCGGDLYCHPTSIAEPRDCTAQTDAGLHEAIPCETAEECDLADAVCRCGMCAVPDDACEASGLRYASSNASAGPCTAGATRVAAGSTHTCALLSDGHAFCWGDNCYGQIGSSELPDPPDDCDATVDVHQPMSVSRDGDALELAQIRTGLIHTCALEGSAAVCWGDNRDGQLGRGTEGGYSSTPDAVMIGPVPFDGLIDFGLGWFHGCGITSAGGAWCWGRNSNGQLGVDDWSGALDRRSEPQEVDSSTAFVSIAAGTSHSCGIDDAGGAWCWGRNNLGQLGSSASEDPTSQPTPVQVLRESDQTPLERVTAIATGSNFTCAATTTPDELWCWGENRAHALGDDSLLGSPDGDDAWLARKVALTLELGVAKLGAGAYTACALLIDGDLWCWGSNEDGRAGAGSAEPWLSPTSIASDIVDVAVGYGHGCLIDALGQVLCWGDDLSGQLGNGAGGNSDEPAPTLELCP